MLLFKVKDLLEEVACWISAGCKSLGIKNNNNTTAKIVLLFKLGIVKSSNISTAFAIVPGNWVTIYYYLQNIVSKFDRDKYSVLYWLMPTPIGTILDFAQKWSPNNTARMRKAAQEESRRIADYIHI